MTTRTTMSEEAFTDRVIELAHTGGWLAYHVRGNTKRLIQGDDGFPDLCMVRQLRVVFAELKLPGEVPTAKQSRWIARLVNAGQEAYLWYPADWDTRIVPCLTKR